MKVQLEAKWEDREWAKAEAIHLWQGARDWGLFWGVTAWVVLWMDGRMHQRQLTDKMIFLPR